MKLLGNRYEIKEKLGSGGMADVYTANDTKLSRIVAVKILHARLASDTVFVERFKREAHAAANLNHPNIVSIYDWGEHDGHYYIVMEVLKGKTLKEVVGEKGKLSPQEAIEYAIQACTALAYAHENKIIHRDIKPQNIVISPDGHVKIADFGIARSSDDGATMTQAGTMLGTPQYFSPEQAQGYPVGKSSDIYSLGICIYEMLAGKPPFNGDSAVAVAYQQVHDMPEKLSNIRDDMPEDLEKVVLKTLAKNPDDRYAVAEDLAADLRRVLAGIPVRIDTSDFDGGKTIIMPPADATLVMPKPTEKRKKKKIIPLIIGLSILAILLGYFAFSASPLKYFLKTEVPNVEGKNVSEAEATLLDKGFKVSISSEPSDEVPKDHVIAQDPAPGSSAPNGSTVKLIVSTGESLVSVPEVIGLDKVVAAQELAKSGLEVGEITFEEKDNYNKDEVISQNPRPDEKVKKGTKVDLVVNKGIELVTVPDLINLSLTEALKKLSDLGLIQGSSEYEFNDKDKDTIVDQSPDSGKSVRKGTQIDLTISKGPELVKVPNLYKLPIEVAKSDLANLGLKSKIEYQESESFAEDIVIAQTPSSGVEVKPGETINLVVSKKPPVTPPTSSNSNP